MSSQVRMLELQNYKSLGHFFDQRFDIFFNKIYLEECDWDEKTAIVPDLLKSFREIAGHVEQLGLFSRNEELEEVKTTELKFLLVPYIVGDLEQNDMNMETRLESLRSALIHFRMFVTQASNYDLADSQDITSFTREDVRLTPAEARTEKIERMKRIDSLNNKIRALRKRIAQFSSSGADDEDGIDGVDEEIHRNLIISLIQNCIARVIRDLSTIESELPMLEEMDKRSKESPAQHQLREFRENQIREKSKNNKPFMLQIKDPSELRNLYRSKVLQPFIELPTMTLAEVADKEMKMETEVIGKMADLEEPDNMVYQPFYERTAEVGDWGRDEDEHVEEVVRRGNARVIRDNAEGFKQDKKRAYDLLDEDMWAREDKDYEEREWDDWKDENPRGAGNKMVNRG